MVMWAGLLYTTFVEVYKIASVSMISCQWAYFWGLRTEKVFGGRLEERGSWSILWLWAHVVLLFRVFLFRGHLESFRRFLDSFVCLFLSSFIFFGAHTFFFTEFSKLRMRSLTLAELGKRSSSFFLVLSAFQFFWFGINWFWFCILQYSF